MTTGAHSLRRSTSRRSLGSAADTEDDEVSGINVTPLVDITLVLLLIFMVTAKLVPTRSLSMDLPRQALQGEIQRVASVELGPTGDLVFDGKRLADDASLLAVAREARAQQEELRAVLRADPAVPHGRVIRVLDLLKQAGITKIGFPARAPVAKP